MRLWPRTLGMQLIVVTAVAVFLSNAAVALWFELGSERLSENDLTERVVDRAASITTLMASIPPKARRPATEALKSKLWQFSVEQGNVVPAPMNPSEARIASRLRSMLPPKYADAPIAVHFASWPGAPPNPHKDWRRGLDTIEMSLPVVRNTRLVATFIKPPPPPWPTEIVIAAIVAALVASAAGAYIARRVARPLSKLADAASLVARGETAPRVPEVGPDDVCHAAQAFNTMTDQVTRTLERQRQLLSAVGHDLRTPITAMRINTEFVEDSELRDRLQRNVDELQALTEAVLSAARGAGGEAPRQIDLSSLVESVCADLDDLGEPVTWQGHPPAPLSCRANEIQRAVRNLIENAVAYGHNADVSIREAGDAYEVVVEDNGPGIAEEDQTRVFEPFVRLESSRNLETGGTGLGLTLVRAIAQGHGGAVALENRDSGGLRATLRLPRKPAKG
ncbi:MAG: HAMP domain-containing protein [Alphaproteobacteria bacterium]|nr:HAMP domain-containing protein [Alphaproteobacteria bacterium]